MQLRASSVLYIVFNVLLIGFFAATYKLMSLKIEGLFLGHDRSAHQQKVELIARSIRHNVLVGDYVGIRRVFQNTLNDNSIRTVRFEPKDGTEGICVGNEQHCYAQKESSDRQSVSSTLYFDANQETSIGTVFLRFASVQAAQLTKITSAYLGGVLLVTLIFFNVLITLFLRAIKKQVSWSIDAVRSLSRGRNVPTRKTVLLEKTEFSKALSELQNVLQDYRKSVEEASKQEALLELAKQVAHDIRSPLSALKLASTDLSELSDEKRILIRSAIDRIQGIANNILERQRASVSQKFYEASNDPTSINSSGELLASLIDRIVAEKRMLYGARSEIDIEFELDPSSYGAFSKISASEFKRMLSNLIDNSVEAIASGGRVTVSLHSQGNISLLSVQDNGRGIAPDILPKLFKEGATFGKKKGSGLGLYHAKRAVESWGGKLELTSALNQGTTVTVVLPQTQAPAWYVPTLQIGPQSTVVVVDDDPSISQAWCSRLGSAEMKTRNIRFVSLSKTQDLLEWREHNQDACQNDLYLVDYEFVGETTNGLNLIEQLAIQAQSILVTNSYEDKTLVEKCLKQKVRLIPKSLLPYLPISYAMPASLGQQPPPG
ncbi:MAG: ATP-binding protein [Deltaproteobacteria bacterium]|nr:ATP-binding protein [Deltaproteobacteria bacterium]